MTVLYCSRFQCANVNVCSTHSHPPDETVISTQKVRNQLRDDARKTKTRPKQLLADAVSAAAPEVRLKLVNNESVKRTIRRQRRGALPKEPSNIQVLLSFLVLAYNCIHSFIHVSSCKRRLTSMDFHLFLSSAVPFKLIIRIYLCPLFDVIYPWHPGSSPSSLALYFAFLI